MLELRNVSFEVDGKKILNNISLTMEDNRFTVITGPNGGGKSTLAKLIMGIEKPTEERFCLMGRTLRQCLSTNGQNEKSVMPFSSPPDLRE